MTATSDTTGVGATPVADRHATTSRAATDWQRYAWAAGIIYVIALVAESVVAIGVGLTQNDSAGKMATALYEHRTRLVVIACLSVVYAASFLIYLWSLYNQLRGTPDRPRILAPLVLAGGVLADPRLWGWCWPSSTHCALRRRYAFRRSAGSVSSSGGRSFT